jgi:hypothetical protein
VADYAKLYDRLMSRALDQAAADLKAFFDDAASLGMSVEGAQARLAEDLETDGPIFGKFFRSLGGASEQSVLAAQRQGVVAGEIMATPELDKLMDFAKIDLVAAVERGDAGQLAKAADAVADAAFVWVCALVNTCPRCLPLHNRRMSMTEWRALGLLPEIMHRGWNSVCQCRLVLVGPGVGEVQPLTRLRAGGAKGSKRTVRAIASADIEKAMAARDKALETPEGRRVLGLLGKVGG